MAELSSTAEPGKGSSGASREASAEKGEIKQYLTLKEIFQVLETHAGAREESSKWMSRWYSSTFQERREMEAESRERDSKRKLLEKKFNLEAEQYFPKEPKISEELAKRLEHVRPRHERDVRGPYDVEANREYEKACYKSCQEHQEVFRRQDPETQISWIERELLTGLKYGRDPMSLHADRLKDFKKLYDFGSKEDRRQIFTLLARDRVESEYPPSMDNRDLEGKFEDYAKAMKVLKKAHGIEGIEKMPIARFCWYGAFEEGENENTPDDKLSKEAKEYGSGEKEEILNRARKIQDLRKKENSASTAGATISLEGVEAPIPTQPTSKA